MTHLKGFQCDVRPSYHDISLSLGFHLYTASIRPMDSSSYRLLSAKSMQVELLGKLPCDSSFQDQMFFAS